MTDQAGRVTVRKDGPVGWVTFDNQARRNAISLDMWRSMPAIFDGLGADPAIRVVVIAGAGDKAFISGADLSQFEQHRASSESVGDYERTSGEGFAAIRRVAVPVIAMIRGYCIGAGMGVAAVCDLRIAATDARFAVPAGKIGLGYSYLGTRDVVDVVGAAFAKEIFFTARQFDADEAIRMGLVNRVVPTADLEKTVTDLAGMIAGNAPMTLKAAKMAIDAMGEDPQDRRMDKIGAAIDACFASQDYAEGRRAFAEKRRPAFKGR